MQRTRQKPKLKGASKAPKQRKARKPTRASGLNSVAAPWQGTMVKPIMPTYNGKQSVRVAHREAVASLRNSVVNTFAMFPQVAQTPGWDLAPGNAALFPWLSNLAVNYEQYHFHKLTFHLVSSQAATVSGRVYMAIDYDWDDEIAPDFMTMMNNRSAVEGPVWNTLSLNCDVAALHGDRYYKYTANVVREAPEPRTTFCGFLMVATNSPTNCVFDLMVEYDVELKVPQGSAITRLVEGVTPAYTPPNRLTSGGATQFALNVPDVPGVVRTIAPERAVVNGVSLNGADAIDITPLKSGNFIMDAELDQPGYSPLAVMAAVPIDPFFGVIFDKAWEYLGISSAFGATSTVGPRIPGQVSSPGQPLRFTTAVDVLAMRAFNAAAAYLVPLVYLGAQGGNFQAPRAYSRLKVEL